MIIKVNNRFFGHIKKTAIFPIRLFRSLDAVVSTNRYRRANEVKTRVST